MPDTDKERETMTLIKYAWSAAAEWFKLRATELRTGRTLIEAIHAEEANLSITAATHTAKEAQAIRELAVELARSGVRADQAPGLLRMLHLSDVLGITPEDMHAYARARMRND